MASARGKKRAAQSLADVQGKMEQLLEQLEAQVASGEKAVKAGSLDFSNHIFGGAQEAFEKCEAINQEVDEQRDRAAAEHAAKQANLLAQRLKLEKGLRDSAAAMNELRSVQEEAALQIKQLRQKIIAVPGKGGRQLKAVQGAAQQAQQAQQRSALRQPGAGKQAKPQAAGLSALGGKPRGAPKQRQQAKKAPAKGQQKRGRQQKEAESSEEASSEEEQDEEEEVDEEEEEASAAGKGRQLQQLQKGRRGVTFGQGK